jgi:hypothetical protein
MRSTLNLLGQLLIVTLLTAAFLPCVAWAQSREETSLWDSVKDSKDAEDYKAYLDKYPAGVYAPLAKRRIAQLTAHPAEQSSTASSPTAKTPSPARSSKSGGGSPVTMTECEGTNNCATWTFVGTQGTGRWPSGEIANLTVENSGADKVVIHRADSSGASAGLTATYTGTRRGERISGELTSVWPSHWDSKSGDWYATIAKVEQSLPGVMRVCPLPVTVCSTWRWNEGHYEFLGDNGVTGVFTIADFTDNGIVFNRVDYGRTAGYTATYTGQISSAGNTIPNGNWSDSNGNTGHFTAAWGSAFDKLPRPGGYNAQAPRTVVVRPVVCYPWFFGIVCSQ